MATDPAVAELECPPKPPLTFRVGVVGHRPNRLRGADLVRLGTVLREVLSAVAAEVAAFHADHARWFAERGPVLRALSPLAEGTDRLFADTALDLGCELCCPMPFVRGEYERDFVPPDALETASLDRFRSILQRASEQTTLTCFELDGDPADRPSAYGACGRVLLHQSDLLVVVWDGQRQNKKGGTEETLDEARRLGTPIVLIDAAAPHAWRLVHGERASVPASPLVGLAQAVRAAIELPAAPGAPVRSVSPRRAATPDQRLAEFHAEHHPGWSVAVFWQIFKDLVGKHARPALSVRVPSFEAAVESEWPRERSTPLAGVVDSLRPYYAWANKLAVVYADRYRSTFLMAFLMAAAAVGMALMPVACGLMDAERHGSAAVFVAGEFGLILGILLVVGYGRRRRWHDRWIDYRLAAELVRHLRLVIPLGGDRPFPQVPAHWAGYAHPSTTWVAWYVRAIERSLGLPHVVVNGDHVSDCLAQMRTMLEGQLRWHRGNAAQSRRIERSLEGTGVVLLALTLVSCALHFVAPVSLTWPSLPAQLTFLCGFLPALGAALAGINNQGEFRRLAKRSEAMVGQLGHLLARLDALSSAPAATGAPPRSAEVAALAADAARLMVNEVSDWRVVFLDRPPGLPA